MGGLTAIVCFLSDTSPKLLPISSRRISSMSTLSSIGSNLSNKSSSKDNIPMSLLGLPIVDYGALPSKYKDIYIYSVWELLQWCAVVPPFKAPRTKATHLYQTKVVSSNPSYSEVYLIQHYVIKIVSGFLWVL